MGKDSRSGVLLPSVRILALAKGVHRVIHLINAAPGLYDFPRGLAGQRLRRILCPFQADNWA